MNMTKEQIGKLRDDVIAYLEIGVHNYLAVDSRIYALGKAYDFKDGKFVEAGDLNPRDFFEFVPEKDEDHILSMSFEGGLYELLNIIGYDEKENKEFREIFSKHGVYFELGNAWNFTCYQKPTNDKEV